MGTGTAPIIVRYLGGYGYFKVIKLRNGIGPLSYHDQPTGNFFRFANGDRCRIAGLPDLRHGQPPRIGDLLCHASELEADFHIFSDRCAIFRIFGTGLMAAYLATPTISEIVFREGNGIPGFDYAARIGFLSIIFNAIQYPEISVQPFDLATSDREIKLSEIIYAANRRLKLEVDMVDPNTGRLDLYDLDNPKRRWAFEYTPRHMNATEFWKKVKALQDELNQTRISLEINRASYEARSTQALCKILLQIVSRVSVYEIEERNGEFYPNRIIDARESGATKPSFWTGRKKTAPDLEMTDPIIKSENQRKVLMHRFLVGEKDIELFVRSEQNQDFFGEEQGSFMMFRIKEHGKTYVGLLGGVGLEESKPETEILKFLRKAGLVDTCMSAMQLFIYLERLEDLRRKGIGEDISVRNLAEFAHDTYGRVSAAAALVKALTSILKEKLVKGQADKLDEAYKALRKAENMLSEVTDIEHLRGQVFVDIKSVNTSAILEIITRDAGTFKGLREMSDKPGKSILYLPPLALSENFEIETDLKKLESIVTNLLGNAFKYGEGSIQVSFSRLADKIVITFTDHGPQLFCRKDNKSAWQIFSGGMTSDENRKLEYASVDDKGREIDPYFQIRHGVGLPGVIRKARAIKAEVFVSYLPDGGKTITLQLPLRP